MATATELNTENPSIIYTHHRYQPDMQSIYIPSIQTFYRPHPWNIGSSDGYFPFPFPFRHRRYLWLSIVKSSSLRNRWWAGIWWWLWRGFGWDWILLYEASESIGSRWEERREVSTRICRYVVGLGVNDCGKRNVSGWRRWYKTSVLFHNETAKRKIDECSRCMLRSKLPLSSLNALFDFLPLISDCDVNWLWILPSQVSPLLYFAMLGKTCLEWAAM